MSDEQTLYELLDRINFTRLAAIVKAEKIDASNSSTMLKEEGQEEYASVMRNRANDLQQAQEDLEALEEILEEKGDTLEELLG